MVTLPARPIDAAGLVLAVGTVVAFAAAAAVLRWPLVPAPDDWCAGRTEVAGAVWSALVAAPVVAAVVAMAARRSQRGMLAGPFAAVAAVVCAGGVPLLAVGLWPDGRVVAVAALGAALALPLLLPLLRERGLLSLAIAAAVAMAPHATALRLLRFEGFAAAPIAPLLGAVRNLPDDVDRVALLLDPELSEGVAVALAVALLPRHAVAATAGTVEAEWLLRMELPALECEPAACRPITIGDPATMRPVLPVEAAVARGEGGAIAGLSVRCAAARAGHSAVLFGPAGTLRAAFDGDGLAVFSAADCARLRAWLRPLPTSPSVRILVLPPLAADAYGWTDLRP